MDKTFNLWLQQLLKDNIFKCEGKRDCNRCFNNVGQDKKRKIICLNKISNNIQNKETEGHTL